MNDDKGGKPEGIQLMIGQRPTVAFGNSDGDQQMLEYTQGGDGARLMLLSVMRSWLRPGSAAGWW